MSDLDDDRIEFVTGTAKAVEYHTKMHNKLEGDNLDVVVSYRLSSDGKFRALIRIEEGA